MVDMTQHESQTGLALKGGRWQIFKDTRKLTWSFYHFSHPIKHLPDTHAFTEHFLPLETQIVVMVAVGVKCKLRIWLSLSHTLNRHKTIPQ